MTQKQADQLNALKAEIKKSWDLALAFDFLEPNASFVIFSKNNPHANTHNNLMIKFFALRKRIQRKLCRNMQHVAVAR